MDSTYSKETVSKGNIARLHQLHGGLVAPLKSNALKGNIARDGIVVTPGDVPQQGLAAVGHGALVVQGSRVTTLHVQIGLCQQGRRHSPIGRIALYRAHLEPSAGTKLGHDGTRLQVGAFHERQR